jgi:hypothetical protein
MAQCLFNKAQGLYLSEFKIAQVTKLMNILYIIEIMDTARGR